MQKIDIIMPCYYSNEIIRPGLEKISNQTIKDQIRLILINDCSPYTSCKYQDIIQEYQTKIDIVYLETTRNSGPGKVRQMGLEYATAPWIWFQDDDDTLYDNNSLENLLTIAESQGGVEEVALVSGSKQAVFVAERRTQREHCIGSVQGTLYNRALLKERGVHFEPLLTWKEEDTAFLTLVICATLDKKQIDYFQPVYIKYWTPGVRSVTTRVDAVNSVYNLLAAKSYCLFYHLKYKFVDVDQPDTTDYYIMIPTFIHNLVTVCQKYRMTITSEMYQTIPQFIQYYFDFIKMITARGWVAKDFDKAKIALSDLFRPDSWFGEIDENVVTNFASIYQLDLEKLKQYISDKNK